jgi:hypothetical protein
MGEMVLPILPPATSLRLTPRGGDDGVAASGERVSRCARNMAAE